MSMQSHQDDKLPASGWPGVAVRALTPADIALLQGFFDANPAYFLTVFGRPALLDEAAQEFHERPPASLPFGQRWLLAYLDQGGSLIGVACVLSDLPAPAIWHISLFMLAEALHGSGAAQAMHAALADWACARGAQWLRLGVVEGNARGKRFWLRQGYLPARQRHGIEMGGQTHSLTVMCKPLTGGDIAGYYALAARDRPDGD